MSRSSLPLHPAWLAAVLVLLLGAGFLIFSKDKNAGDDGGGDETGARSSKSSGRRSGDSGPGGSRRDGKSRGKTDEERIGGAPAAVYDGDPATAREYTSEVSKVAREDLKSLREEWATEFDDPDERRAFGVQLGKITNPQERAQVLRERTEAMRAARAEMEARKGPEVKAQEVRLVKLMQLDSLARMAEQLHANQDLRGDAEQVSIGIAKFASQHDNYNTETFNRDFGQLQTQLNELRKRNAAARQPPAPAPR